MYFDTVMMKKSKQIKIGSVIWAAYDVQARMPIKRAGGALLHNIYIEVIFLVLWYKQERINEQFHLSCLRRQGVDLLQLFLSFNRIWLTVLILLNFISFALSEILKKYVVIIAMLGGGNEISVWHLDKKKIKPPQR